jgi:hypothetical protein
LSPDPFNTTAATGWLGYAYLEAGQPAAALPWLEQSLAGWTRFEYGPLIVLFTAWLADATWRSGDLDRAAQLAQRALDVNRHREFRWAAGWAERVLGHIARERGDAHAAGHRFGRALGIYRSIKSRFETARTLVDLASFCALAMRNRRPNRCCARHTSCSSRLVPTSTWHGSRPA